MSTVTYFHVPMFVFQVSCFTDWTVSLPLLIWVVFTDTIVCWRAQSEVSQ